MQGVYRPTSGLCTTRQGEENYYIKKKKKTLWTEISTSKPYRCIFCQKKKKSFKSVIFQKKYVLEMLKRFHMLNYNPIRTSAEKGLIMSKDPNGKKVDSTYLE